MMITDYQQIHSELKKISGYKTNLSVTTLESGTRLIVQDGCEILVPKQLREKMSSTLHFTHNGNEKMMKQAKVKIFWPGMLDDL